MSHIYKAALQDAARNEANRATIERNMEMLQARINELEAKSAALEAVALAVDSPYIYPAGDYDVDAWARLLIALDAARDAGYLTR